MKKIKNEFIFYFFVVIESIFLFSCATTINVRVTRPGNLDLNGAKTIAVLPFKQSVYNPFDYVFDEEDGSVERYFNQYNNIRSTEKKLLDYLHRGLEDKLRTSPYISLANYIPTETALKYRSKVPVDVFISGDVVSFKVYDFTRKVKVPVNTEDVSSKEVIVNNDETTENDNNFIYENEYSREVQFIFKYQIMNGNTMDVLAFDTINIDRISDYVKERKNLPDVYSMVNSDIDSFVKSLMEDIQPYTVNKTIKLLEDKSKNPLMESADKLAKDGNLKQSYNEFLNIYNTTGQFEAGYNAGMLLLAMGQLHDAEKLMNEVYSVSGNTKALDAIYDIKNEIMQAKRLNNQIGN